MTEKQCVRCLVFKELDEFPYKEKNLDKHSGTCKKCANYIVAYRARQRKERERKALLKPTSGCDWPISTI